MKNRTKKTYQVKKKKKTKTCTYTFLFSPSLHIHEFSGRNVHVFISQVQPQALLFVLDIPTTSLFMTK